VKGRGIGFKNPEGKGGGGQRRLVRTIRKADKRGERESTQQIANYKVKPKDYMGKADCGMGAKGEVVNKRERMGGHPKVS